MKEKKKSVNDKETTEVLCEVRGNESRGRKIAVSTRRDQTTKFLRDCAAFGTGVDNSLQASCVLESPLSCSDMLLAARRSKLVPQVLSSLRRLEGNAQVDCSVSVSKALEKDLARIVGHQSLLERAKSDAWQAFNCQGVRFVHFRGSAIARNYYPENAIRMSSDIDVLIHEDDLANGCGALLDLGFHFRKLKAFREAQAAVTGQTEFLHMETGVVLDLHWRLNGNVQVGPYSFDVAQMLHRATGGSHGELVLSDEDTLLETIQHAAVGHLFGATLVRSFLDTHYVLLGSRRPLDFGYMEFQLATARMVRPFQIYWNLFESIWKHEYEGRTNQVPLRRFSRIEVSMVSSCVGRELYAEDTGRKLYEMKEELHKMALRTLICDSVFRILLFVRVFILPTQSELQFLVSEGKAMVSLRDRLEILAGSILVLLGSAVSVPVRMLAKLLS